ncbi:hypothetical protein AVEN_193317-1, partial [Araneus ventricosus]
FINMSLHFRIVSVRRMSCDDRMSDIYGGCQIYQKTIGQEKIELLNEENCCSVVGSTTDGQTIRKPAEKGQ